PAIESGRGLVMLAAAFPVVSTAAKGDMDAKLTLLGSRQSAGVVRGARHPGAPLGPPGGHATVRIAASRKPPPGSDGPFSPIDSTDDSEGPKPLLSIVQRASIPWVDSPQWSMPALSAAVSCMHR